MKSLQFDQNPPPSYRQRQTARPFDPVAVPGVDTIKRKYDVTFLNENGDIEEFSVRAPATPAFEDAFCAFGHGAIFQTRKGVMAIEDLLPGDEIRLASGRSDTLLWCGSTTLVPEDDAAQRENRCLVRVTADAYGPQRPSQDLVLGPSARILHKTSATRTPTGAGAALIPVHDFVDGVQMVAIQPVAAVRVYQLGFDQHQILDVGGIHLESLHPGSAFSLGLRGDLLTNFLSLFPHKTRMEDFGTPQLPRLRLRDLELFQTG